MDEAAKKWIYWTIPIVVVVGLAAALYYGRKQREAATEPAAVTEPAAPSGEPAIQHPIEEEPDAPLPTLDESDPALLESLRDLFGGALEPFLIPQNIVRHIVVTIDNLPRKKLAVERRPLKPTPGVLVTSGGAEPTLSPENAKRYAPLMKIVESADMARVAAVYRRFYPLFQQAYVDLGYPEGYFNDRLVEVIDHLLATPEVQGPIELTQPSVFYEFADLELEQRSAGQKLLIRMGNEHAATIKAKLRQFREEITSMSPPGR
jgi:hypothetical protein